MKSLWSWAQYVSRFLSPFTKFYIYYTNCALPFGRYFFFLLFFPQKPLLEIMYSYLRRSLRRFLYEVELALNEGIVLMSTVVSKFWKINYFYSLMPALYSFMLRTDRFSLNVRRRKLPRIFLSLINTHNMNKYSYMRIGASWHTCGFAKRKEDAE